MNNTLIQTDRFTLSETERSAIEHELHHYEDPRAASIEALKIVQKERGWVPDGALYAIGEILGIPASDVDGVATFYSQILNKLGIGLGQTTPDGRFTLLPVCCLGNCDKAPALMIDDDTFGDVQPAGVTQLLEGYP